ncbi:uncharacterized protein PHALS_12000 [Plasmopara halstedii]|uniref:Uncharacterized protein n=1 Tax=Plasmopara halstedii TaxID=4781 RepID=A0A0P1A693_PLAHL|nr:uncharacterized protein PHALS_12000 [Plasmopara halstedii]CEG35676.1 hypothetical protein PHALS_12000 [Plasmopara halstedii]|eukprot:XP_024572045.1 hypothetical protein PHALS_12000 [Plasmopara halstedii]
MAERMRYYSTVPHNTWSAVVLNTKYSNVRLSGALWEWLSMYKWLRLMGALAQRVPLPYALTII